jgi:hypothetical protein
MAKSNGSNGTNGTSKPGRTISNVRVGKPQTKPSAPSHTRGIRAGNAVGNFEKEAGLEATADGARATARRSTSINPKARDPIDPRMPRLPPA